MKVQLKKIINSILCCIYVFRLLNTHMIFICKRIVLYFINFLFTTSLLFTCGRCWRLIYSYLKPYQKVFWLLD